MTSRTFAGLCILIAALLAGCRSSPAVDISISEQSVVGMPSFGMTDGIPTSDNTFAASQRKVVRAPNGTIYVAYVKRIDGFDQVYVARSTDGGKTFDDFPQISSGPSRSSNPTIVADRVGHLRLFWTRREIVSPERRRELANQPTRMFDPGSRRLMDMSVPRGQESGGGHSGHSGYRAGSYSAMPEAIPPGKKPDSLLSGNNSSLEDSDDEQIRQLYTSSFDGTRWTPQQQLTQGEYNGFPSAAYDSHGVLHLVWYGYDGHYYQVAYSSFARGHWAQPVQISLGYPDSVNPSLVVDGRDDLFVAWYKYSPATKSYQIDFREYSHARQRWEPQLQLSEGLHTAMNVSLTVGSQNTLLVAYDGKSTARGQSGVYVREREGSGFRPQKQVGPASLGASMPSIAANREGRVFLLFQSAADGRIYLSTSVMSAGDREGGAWSEPGPITSGPRDEFPVIGWSYDGAVRRGIDFVWTRLGQDPQERHGANRIHFRHIAR